MSEKLDNFREAKYSLFMQVGNIRDINNMTMKDFNNLMRYLKFKDDKDTGKAVPLKQSQKDMIKKAKEKKEDASR